MRLLCWCALSFAGVLALASTAQAADEHDPLVRARAFYNQRDFEASVAAADEGGRQPQRADSADLIAARAYLERYRQSAASDDLTNARDRLRRIRADHLDSHERTEFVVGLGEALYFDAAAGAAAQIFDSLLVQPGGLSLDARERVLDWWASALDRDARVRPDLERQGLYQKIRDRMRAELGADPASASAAYWLSAAALGQGDVQAAWDAAEAGWVRAPLSTDGGSDLRGDLDKLVDRGIAPERSKVLGRPADTFRAEWQRFKEKWEK
jgi:hypothetical protein